MSRLAIRGGTVLDQSGQSRTDVAIEDGRIVDVGATVDGDVTLDASGCIVNPGFVDLHVHLREPGREEAETIETGSRAAALGGFTAVVGMPNTDPAQDSVAVVACGLPRGARWRSSTSSAPWASVPGCARCSRRGASPSVERAPCSRRSASWPPPACA